MQEEKAMIFKNHHNLNVYLYETDLANNLEIPDCIKIFNNLEKVISDPDEVWQVLQPSSPDVAEIKIIKFYQGCAIVCIIDITEMSHQILRTWRLIQSEIIEVNGEKINAVDYERRGIPLKIRRNY